MPGAHEDLFLPDGVPLRVAEQLAAVLDQLYSAPDCGRQRY